MSPTDHVLGLESAPAVPTGTGDPRTDEQLLDDHVSGDRDAFPELVSRHYGYLRRLAVRTSFNPDDAAEALQDALISAFRSAHTFRRGCPVKGWLYRIVVNACLDKMRAQRLRTHTSLTSVLHERVSLREHFTQDPTISIIVAEALSELPVEQRDAIVVIDMLRFTVAEASRLLAVPPGTIKSRCARGRARLAGRLDGLGSLG